ncbi:translation initiation factor IF-2-like [Hordeum vulgare subsp. vulgare]|uniref:Uncharacterized protein n=1 Tax=Hordeum vulgare subsp. vulgare TaxID=112509 RepID=A0A8I6WIY4_HORVV|nr:translation initiation factor IF-2-like [Hordeum vulgare subsp. vulgare]
MDVNNMIRSHRVDPDSLPLAGGGGASRKPAAKPSKDERAPDVVAGTSRVAPYFPRTSLENRPASSSAALVSHHHRQRCNVVAMHTSHSQGPDLGAGGGSGVASPAAPVQLRWGHGKRSRSRREAPVHTPAPEPELLTPAEVRRRASLKFRSRKAAKKEQARAGMQPPPPGARVAPSSLPPRAGTLWLHGYAPPAPPMLGSWYPRIVPGSFPFADGAGSSVTRKPAAPTPAPTPSRDERVPAVVVADTSCLAPYFASTSPEHHMPRGPPPSSPAALVSRHLYNAGMRTYQEPNIGGGASKGIAAPDAHVLLQWGQSKRSRSRREAPTPTPAHESVAVQTQAAAVKMMLPSTGARDPNLVASLQLPPHAAVTLSLRSSSEEPHTVAGAGEKQPAAKEEKQQPAVKEERRQQQQTQRLQRQASIKATEKQRGKAPMVGAPPHVEQEEEEEEKAAMARPVVPRIVTQLTRDEKEEDWLAMTGSTKLPRRPHRRPEIVQEQVTNIYPGQRLSQVKMTRYRVTEKKSKKCVGGLKGMAMDDDDSD